MKSQPTGFQITSLVILGNILEYYDFLLFMHLGPIVTPLFFPGYSSKETHFLSLLLFGLAFVIRPIGGYIFGRLSDHTGRKNALVQSVKWAVFPAFGLSLLPSYDTLGILATALFVFFRLFQGVALGGEYPNAGTYLMEYSKKNHGLVSGILSASGSIGSLLGFSMAFLCTMQGSPEWLWRTGFFLGGVAGLLSYRMRKILAEMPVPKNLPPQDKNESSLMLRWSLVAAIGMIVGTTTWLPMTYSNFYLTKVLGYESAVGLSATLIALLAHVLFTPIFGAVSDLFDKLRYMLWACFVAIPLSFISYNLLSSGQITLGQVGFIVAAACFGAPIHAVMNSLFIKQVRGRRVAFLFMVGLSLGGMAPSLCSVISDKTSFQYAPPLLLSLIATFGAALFYLYTRRLSTQVAPSS